ncbi:MAG TPA: amino acid adenylation domain-containing protein, partial [Pseudomonas sp.]|uniref:amino acid adenylation domain-containing protein n=1 Tax=Pseudomonas sp. TaxID=306 RepID=UPI002EDAC28A
DAELEPVARGCSGQLYIGQAGLARGYLNRAGLTAERFVPDPFGAPGGRLYRSGDLARYGADGSLDYLGRADQQVKIRGFRIELGEIETSLLQDRDVRQVAVLAVEGPAGAQLVGYLVAEVGAQQRVEWLAALKQRLKAELPEHMVPAHLMVLDALPLTAHGKLDRQALPSVDVRQTSHAYAAPEGEREQALAAIWASVLGVDQVGRNDNFFDMGGDSIVSIQLVSRARQAGLQFTPRDLFEHQTIAQLARCVNEQPTRHLDQSRLSGNLALLPIHRWFFELALKHRHHWNQSVLLRPSSALEPQRLRQAIEALVEHHDALRLTFKRQDSRWCASYAAEQSHEWLWVAQLENTEAIGPLADEAQASLDLNDGPLLRAVLMTLPAGEQRLLLVFHHLLVDGVSWRILLEDLQQAYQTLAHEKPVCLPQKTSSVRAWAEQLQGRALNVARDELGYWEAGLGGASTGLAADHAEGRNRFADAEVVKYSLSREQTQRLLQRVAPACRAGVDEVLIAVLAKVICDVGGQPSTVLRLEGHGRQDDSGAIDLSRTVGWFTSMYPVKLTPANDLIESVRQVKTQLRQVPEKGIGYAILRYLSEPAVQARMDVLPKGDILFNYLGQFDQSFDREQGLFAPAKEGHGAAQHPDAPLDVLLSINGQVYGGELSLDWVYSRECFTHDTISGLVDRFTRLVNELIERSHTEDFARTAITGDFPLVDITQKHVDTLLLANVDLTDIYPLTPMQQGMFFHAQLERHGGAYVNQMQVEVSGLDLPRFRRAWQASFDAHETLRAQFVTVDGTTVQVIRGPHPLPFVELDWQGQGECATALAAWAQADLAAGFDLASEPLLRVAVIRLDDQRYHLVYTSHHIVLDGWSNARLLGEVLQRYGQQPVPASAGAYRAYLKWLHRQDAKATEVFWQAQLQAVQAPTRLARPLPANVDQQARHMDHYRTLDSIATARLGAFAREHRVTFNTLVQLAWALVLQRHTGQTCVTYGATVSGRPAHLAGVEEQLGLFINTLPVILAPDPQSLVVDALLMVQEHAAALREYEHTPLYEVQRWAGYPGESLFDTLLVFENYPVSQALQDGGGPVGLSFGPVSHQEQTHFPLTIGVGVDEQCVLHFNYQVRHFTAARVEQLSGQLAQTLIALAHDWQTCLGALSGAGAQAQSHVIEQWSRGPAPGAVAPFVHEAFQAQAALTPQAPALVFEDLTLSYDRLDRRSNALARWLSNNGVGAEVLVGIACERSPDMAIALLAVLKVGAAYVPIDPQYPAERLSYMIADSQLGLLLTQSHLLERWSVDEGLPVLCIDQMPLMSEADQRQVPHVRLHPAQLAYVIYTSGSTGKPKGVGISHGVLSRFSEVARDYSKLSERDRVLQFSTFSFDGFVEQFFPALTAGAAIVMRGPDMWTPQTLCQQMRRHQVTVADLPATYWRALAEQFAKDGASVPQSLRQVHVGGEAMPLEGLSSWHEAGLDAVCLLNTYGPTEATVVTTVHDCTALRPADVSVSGVPIGRPLQARSTYVVDADLRLQDVDMMGDLLIGGSECLARGYHLRPGLTAERFIPDPFGPSGERLYRTGDLARFNSTGALEYGGRADHQIKLRGYRVEPGEIEARLMEHPTVDSALVVVNQGPMGPQLVGYVAGAEWALAQGDTAQRVMSLKAWLKEALPDFMVPTHLIGLAAFPLTLNGKVDRNALPSLSSIAREHLPLATDTERALGKIWSDLLKVDQVGGGDNFFELGGHSLLAAQAISRINTELGVDMPLRLLFELPILSDFACAIAEHGMANDEPGLADIEHLMNELTGA